MRHKVSVIVAMYNSEQYLDKCVQSLLNQTLDDYEIILVNDCSPDNSYIIAKNYEKDYPNKVKVINHEKNMRAGAARNSGVKFSNSKYVWFVDADDWLDSTALEKAYLIAEKNKSDIVSVDFYEVISDNDDPVRLRIGVPDICCGDMNLQKKNDYIVECSGGFSKLIRKEFLLDNKLFYPEGILFEDNGIVPLIGAMARRIDSIHEGLYYYRVGNPDSQSKRVRSENVIVDRLKAMEYFLEKTVELDIYDDLHSGIEFFFVFIYYVSNIRTYIKGSCNFSYQTYKKMKGKTYSEFPHFKKNKYFKERFSSSYKFSVFISSLGWIPVKITRFAYSIFH